MMQNMLIDGKISWLDLATVINSDSTASNFSDILFEYYKTIEYLYEEIIKKWNFYEKVMKYGYK